MAHLQQASSPHLCLHKLPSYVPARRFMIMKSWRGSLNFVVQDHCMYG
ncbi:unnamed protein product [Linum tenue]|uniref:Uncharacterized protein n=1 Tax=Linum tenue TaxID=586396 RepID=A0AAV0P453_9ROSI|nr:unnamed protein product [Linum tenue]